MLLNTCIIISYTCFIGIFKKVEVVMVQVLVAVKLWWREGARGCQVPRGAIFPNAALPIFIEISSLYKKILNY